MEVTGKVEDIEGFHACVEWQKLENLSLSGTDSTFSLVKGSSSADMVSKWLGIGRDPDTATGIRFKMPFWELKHDSTAEDQQKPSRAHISLEWKETCKKKDETRMSLPDLFIDHPLGNVEPARRVLDALKHRTDVFSELKGDQESSEGWGNDSDDIDNGDGNEKSGDNHAAPFQFLLDILGKCNLSGKQRIFQMLCDQRYSVPLIYRNKDTDELMYLVNSLRFVDTKLKDRNVGLMEDKTLRRVVFVSGRSENLSQSLYMVKEIFKCNMGSHNCNSELMAELSVGFLSSGDKATSNINDPWLVLHIKGNYSPLKDFIEKFADLIVFEVDVNQDTPGQKIDESLSKRRPVLKWKITNDELKASARKMTISGLFHDVASKMTEAIPKIAKKENLKEHSRQAMVDIDSENIKIINEIVGIDSIAASVKNISFLTARDELDMQKSFVKECKYKYEMYRIRGDSPKMTGNKMKVDEEIDKRRNKASCQINLPILADFLAVLRTEDRDLRIVALNEFEKNLNEQCAKVLCDEKKRYKDAWDHYISLKDQPEGENARKKYFEAKLAYANKSLGFQHLWRELSHIYVARPSKNKDLPELAAQHLTDGFVFEILDGDAGIVNGEWMKAVLQSLKRKLKQRHGCDPNVCILSILGNQSTGKSTLLNTMFGCRLKVSAGKCTRGINLQLVRIGKRTRSFDYILVMDTEGLRSPEFFGTEGAILRDNRLATFSILPADATIITMVNEEDAAIKEVLPIVMLAFKGSNIAEEISGRLRSMMFFVYSRVDTSKQALEKFENNRCNLQLELQEALMKIENFQTAEGAVKVQDENTSNKKPSSKSLSNFLRNFRLDDDEKESDVKYLGLLNKGEEPPDDTPNFDFGQKVAKIREYMFKRLAENKFQGQSLNNWSRYLDLVCQCVDTTDFELNFKTAMEFQAFNQLKSSIDNSKQIVSKKYSTEYKNCEDEILNVQAGEKLDLDNFKQKFYKAAQETIVQEEKNLLELLNKEINKAYKKDELVNWNSFIEDIKKTFGNLLKDCFDAKFIYGEIVLRYEQNILRDLERKYKEDPNLLIESSEREKVFEEVFRKQLQEAKSDHPPIAIDENIDIEYGSLKHINIDRMLRDKIGKPWTFITKYHKREDDDKKAENMYQELIARAQWKLDSVTHYDSSVVQEVMEYTNEKIRDKKVHNKQNQEMLHARIQQYLKDRFTSIQNKWDEQHNIAKKLEKEKPTLRQKFHSICEGFMGRRTVAADIVSGIKVAIENGFTEYLADDTKGKVETKPWISKSEVMQAHIDLDLLLLSKQRKTRQLLDLISEGSYHYEKILFRLILKEVDSDCCWEVLKKKLCEGIPQAAEVASILENERSSKFIAEVNSRLKSSIKKHLPSTTWEDLKKHQDKLSKDDFNEIGELIKKAFKATLSKPRFNDMKLAENIQDKLKLEGLLHSQPRCSVSCPRCGMTCRKPASHVKEKGRTEAKHDCKHQPEGLVGVAWADDDRADELVNESCVEHVTMGHSFIIEENSTPFSKFEEMFDTWQLPNCTNVAKVRKYIFRKHQKDLADFYGRKECSEITGNYDLETLEDELDQIING